MRFKTLSVETWQQFEQVDIDFHPRLTILTGANGCGKTTLLKLLAQHRGWPSVQVATPAKNKVTGVIEFFTRRIKGKDKSSDSIIGKLSYTSGQEATLIIPDAKVANYQINISNLQAINCFFIPSHRQTFRYEPVQNIPVTKKTEQTAFDEVYSVGLQRHNGGHSQSASFFIKNTLIGWAIQGYGIKGKENKVVMPADSPMGTISIKKTRLL